eukprot:14509257-Heterocapsa_arctica.AAC.1
MATTRRSESMLLSRFHPHAKTCGNYCAPVCGAPVNPEPNHLCLKSSRRFRTSQSRVIYI